METFYKIAIITLAFLNWYQLKFFVTYRNKIKELIKEMKDE